MNHKEHSFTDGEVRCWCSFILAWQDGPDTGKLATTSIESVCFLQDGPLNRTLVEFIKMSRVKVMNSVKHSRSVPVHESTQGLVRFLILSISCNPNFFYSSQPQPHP